MHTYAQKLPIPRICGQWAHALLRSLALLSRALPQNGGGRHGSRFCDKLKVSLSLRICNNPCNGYGYPRHISSVPHVVSSPRCVILQTDVPPVRKNRYGRTQRQCRYAEDETQTEKAARWDREDEESSRYIVPDAFSRRSRRNPCLERKWWLLNLKRSRGG